MMVGPSSQKTAHQRDLEFLEMAKEVRFGKGLGKAQGLEKSLLFGNGIEETLQVLDSDGIEHLSNILLRMGNVTIKILHLFFLGERALIRL